MNKVVVTGSSGFIGYSVSLFLLEKGYQVEGMDNMNDYYETSIKKSRLRKLREYTSFSFHEIDLKSKDKVDNIFKKFKPDYVIHLAAQAGVRYSIQNPYVYIDSNIVGFMNILEACRNYQVKHLIYASSSSVYGANMEIPYTVNQKTDHPISLYAATKKANELMAYSYSHLFGIPTTGLRFFTVYGPWGRPDMAYYIFTKNILEGKPIKVFNHGKMERDLTYIDDIVNGLFLLLDKPPMAESEKQLGAIPGTPPYKIYNIGNSQPIKLEKFISILENKIGVKAEKIYLDMQPGDMLKTYSDISDIKKDIGFEPKVTIEEGLGEFVNWFRSYHKI